jgi:hypothetical protein
MNALGARQTPNLSLQKISKPFPRTVPARRRHQPPDAPKARPFGRRENAGVPRPSGHHAGVPAKPRTFPSRQRDRHARSEDERRTTQRDRHARSEDERRTTQRDRHARSEDERRATQRDRHVRSGREGAHATGSAPCAYSSVTHAAPVFLARWEMCRITRYESTALRYSLLLAARGTRGFCINS